MGRAAVLARRAARRSGLLLRFAGWFYSRWWFWGLSALFGAWVTFDWAAHKAGAWVPASVTAVLLAVTVVLYLRRGAARR